jgi:hypothetical protein
VGKLERKGNLEQIGGDGKIILKYISRNGIGSVDWINLAQERFL